MDALLVFARVPEPGAVKTRLIPRLGPEGAARLYAAMLDDALDTYATLGVSVRVYLTPGAGEDARALPPALVTSSITVHAQRGDTLGDRMRNAFLDAFAAGAHRAVVIGTDHPTLPPAFVGLAFAHLDAPRTVTIGPADDGGYYLLGMRDVAPALFAGMTYSHPGVFADTLARAAADDRVVTVLPPWYDVDEPASLDRLRDDLAADPGIAPRTRAALAALDAAPD